MSKCHICGSRMVTRTYPIKRYRDSIAEKREFIHCKKSILHTLSEENLAGIDTDAIATKFRMHNYSQGGSK